MTIRVLKFGGTSVATHESRMAALRQIQRAQNQGTRIVVVVSAMGRRGEPYATDTLLDVPEHPEHVSPRERDLLMACGETISAVAFASLMREHGLPATALSGADAGIMTDDRHGDASIVSVATARIESEWVDGHIPVVTGFQGITGEGAVTTLGRGGSDTTATGLGVALEAEAVDIFTDVEGVMTADPRVVPDAKRVPLLSYQEMYQFAAQGAKVVHPRAVDLAMQRGVPIYVRKTGSDGEGTLIGHDGGALEGTRSEHQSVIGVTQQAHVARMYVQDASERCGEVFDGLARRGLSVDWISSADNGLVCVTSGSEAQGAAALLKDLGLDPDIDFNCAKVAVIGRAASDTMVLARATQSLESQGIEIVQSGHLAQGVGVLVRQPDMAEAVRTLHAAFGLGDSGCVPLGEPSMQIAT